MAHTLLREKATQLKLQGFTYGQIKRELGIAKATLSGWLSHYPLTEERLKTVLIERDHNRDIAGERYRNTQREKRLKRLQETYNLQKNNLLPLSEKELFIAGIFLYWGEGGKHKGQLSVSNTNPNVLKFVLFWMTHVLKVPLGKIKANLHLYKDMDVEETINYWARTLNLPKEQFSKPYIKKSNRADLTYKSFGYGTCRLYHCSVLLCEQVAMSIKAISDTYGTKSDIFWYN